MYVFFYSNIFFINWMHSKQTMVCFNAEICRGKNITRVTLNFHSSTASSTSRSPSTKRHSTKVFHCSQKTLENIKKKTATNKLSVALDSPTISLLQRKIFIDTSVEKGLDASRDTSREFATRRECFSARLRYFVKVTLLS